MSDERRKDVNWKIKADATGIHTIEQATLAVLMDIRDEFKLLNRLLACPNFIGIPATLRSIRRAMPSKKRAA